MALLSLPGGDGAMAADEPLWPDSFLTRVEALALIQGLNADLLASRSATLTLEAWCRTHRLADPPTVVAHLDRTVDKPATAEQRRRLEVADDEPVRFRRVRLYCGDKLLSEADNWYVPGRLTVGMNQILDSTDTPFGKAVLELGPTRQTFAAKMLWSPLPDGWERAPVPASSPVPGDDAGPIMVPDALFEHRALLFTAGRVPFSEVAEVYQRQLLAFPPPPR
ncbi:MAG: hypothetical protein F8N37_21450 [Telmatospirillum sp.]|nr:hypothetical protein [Telmatospirillum sp.]